MTTAEKLQKIDEGVEETIALNAELEQTLYGADTGGKSHYDEFWDAYQDNGTRTNYYYAFTAPWEASIFKPKYDIRPVDASHMFFNNMGSYIKIDDFVAFCEERNIVLDMSNCTSAAFALGTLHTKHHGVLDFRKCTNLERLFYSQNYEGVATIDEFISSEITVFASDTFECVDLKNITFSGVIASNIDFNRCTELTHDSIVSVVTHLSTTATGMTATFSKTAVNNAFETSEGAADGSTSAEWLALIGTRSNWTISLV